jgi:hypothetical protein
MFFSPELGKQIYAALSVYIDLLAVWAAQKICQK